jgi:hypothetical protein
VQRNWLNVASGGGCQQSYGATAPTTGTLTGKVTNASGGAAISGATVSISGGGSATTDSNGNYTISNVAAGTVNVTASMSGFTSSTVNGVSITAGNTTTQNFSLTASGGGVPGASSLSAASSGFTHGIKLTWTAAANNGSVVTNYRVYRATASGGPFTLITTLGNVLSYTDTGNPSFRTSYYQVVAVNAVGAGPASNTASAFSF